MADYFQEMGWQPLSDGQAPNHLLHFARLFRDYNIFDESLTQTLAPPASKSVVENLPSITINEQGVKCPVCLKEHGEGETVKKMPCNHTFHAECILPWLEKTNSCPLCRFELATDDEDYEAFRKEKLRAKAREADIEILHNSMFS
ncbi:E3 ubiquitin-protein ligase RNF181-like [Tribolium madens]|uniref:E3 ubiquitin-protein ligase RNF181-like n=1 Tax=Tribolium madens TaxID=41895 RepID=UPI001CF73F4A|nr:E3 ubiquitin-protein ligase RNF181-like [Tribolium madens]